MRTIITTLALLLAATSSQAQTFNSSAGQLKVETVAKGLDHPWSIAFLPDGQLLVTERVGHLRIVARDGTLSAPALRVPKVFSSGQGGLLDVVLDRNFAGNRTIYFCFADDTGKGARTSLAKAALPSGGTPRLDNVTVIFKQDGPLSKGLHFGCRIVQGDDGNLFLTTGEHGTFSKESQNLGNHLGKVIRIRPDGSVPPDNPFVNREGAKPEIWSYGHRNMQGAAKHPESRKLWTHEHGPRGGDEINIPQAGKNYGWPVIGYGIDYSGRKIHTSVERAGMEQPIKSWVPSIAPSGMAFNTGNLFPQWKGNLFVGALAGQILVRLELDGEKVVNEERLLADLKERIRDVRVGPDGAIYLATDNANGRILRVTPAK